MKCCWIIFWALVSCFFSLQATAQSLPFSSPLGFSFFTLTPPANQVLNLPFLEGVVCLDQRQQKKWIGFVPVNLEQKKKGTNTVALVLDPGPANWLGLVVQPIGAVVADSTASLVNKRQAVLVLREFWFSQNAQTHRHSPNSGLETTLHYALDVYTLVQGNYFAQFQFEGQLTLPYANGLGYNQLLAAFTVAFSNRMQQHEWLKKEQTKMAIAPAIFGAFYAEKSAETNKAFAVKKGLYNSYAQYLQQEPAIENIVVAQSFTLNQQVPVYAILLKGLAEDAEKNTYGTWGYSDGQSLFYHLGNGFFVKLVPGENHFYFPHLNYFLRDNIKAKYLTGLRLGQSDYALIKEYSRINPLTYSLNLTTGELY